MGDLLALLITCSLVTSALAFHRAVIVLRRLRELTKGRAMPELGSRDWRISLTARWSTTVLCSAVARSW